jgi:NADH dehydrogenase FAD-containing subunit
MKNIIVLGGSYAGIGTIHRILKQTTQADAFKITLVSPNTHLYWNMASPRGLIPGQLTDDQLFQPIAGGFKQYSDAGVFEFIVGSAESLDVEAKKVMIAGPTGNTSLEYDFLILATGSRTKEQTPFKMIGSTKDTKDILHDYQERVKKAKTIVVAGGGVTSVEIAGELGFEYGLGKEIILVSSQISITLLLRIIYFYLEHYDPLTLFHQLTRSPAILDGSPESISKIATRELQKLHVNVKHKTQVTDSSRSADGRHNLTLSTGDNLVADLYIPLFGLTPNSSYVPSKFLDTHGFVQVDEFLKVKGADGVWAIGDVSDTEFSQYVSLDKQSVYLAKHIVSVLSSRVPVPYKPATSRTYNFFPCWSHDESFCV